jgi:hypothetical protein
MYKRYWEVNKKSVYENKKYNYVAGDGATLHGGGAWSGWGIL